MGVNYTDIIERMRWAGKLKNDSAVARTLGVTPQALSNYKKRGEMHTDLVLRFAGIYGLSVDWLITGQGQMYNASPQRMRRLIPRARRKRPDPRSTAKTPDFSALTPDEIILMSNPKIPGATGHATAIKYSVDALLRASECAGRPKEDNSARTVGDHGF